MVSLHLFYFEISQVNYVKGQYKVNYSIIYLNFDFLITYLPSESWTVCATNARFRFAKPSTISLGAKYHLQSIFLHARVPNLPFQSDPWYPMCVGCNVLVQEHLAGKHKLLHPTHIMYQITLLFINMKKTQMKNEDLSWDQMRNLLQVSCNLLF